MTQASNPKKYIIKGRGKTAPYKTCHYRIPVPLKPVIELLANSYRQLVQDYESPDDPELINTVLASTTRRLKAVDKILSDENKPKSCPKCKFRQLRKSGHQGTRQYWKCKRCEYRFTTEPSPIKKKAKTTG